MLITEDDATAVEDPGLRKLTYSSECLYFNWYSIAILADSAFDFSTSILHSFLKLRIFSCVSLSLDSIFSSVSLSLDSIFSSVSLSLDSNFFCVDSILSSVGLSLYSIFLVFGTKITKNQYLE